LFFPRIPPPPSSTLFPYTTLFRSELGELVPRLLPFLAGSNHLFRHLISSRGTRALPSEPNHRRIGRYRDHEMRLPATPKLIATRSEEHTSELQSRSDLVCRLLLEQ